MSGFFRVGREAEVRKIQACLAAGRHLLLEGPVGSGKTHLALAVTGDAGVPVFRIDGDSRYSEQKLTGWFDPPLVVQKGFGFDSFLPGPLVQAMQSGGVLFINELNRLPEGVQNVLLPAIDERLIVIPRLGEIRAKDGFVVVATQNPKEFVATSHLSEAILDRFEWTQIGFQAENEEREIVAHKLEALIQRRPNLSSSLQGHHSDLRDASVRLCRATRNHPKLKRGASVRGAIAVSELTLALLQVGGKTWQEAFVEAALLALPTRIELKPEGESGPHRSAGPTSLEALIAQMAQEALRGEGGSGDSGKKTPTP